MLILLRFMETHGVALAMWILFRYEKVIFNVFNF